MTKYITVAALLAAGSAFADADVYTTTLTGNEPNNGYYYGFTVALTDTFMNTTEGALSADLELNLDSVQLTARTTGSLSSAKLAVYAYSADGTTGTFVGLSDNAVDVQTSLSAPITFDFSDITITAGTQYQFLFVSASATADSVDTFDEYKANALRVGISILKESSTLPKGDGIYTSNNLNSWQEGNFMPALTITTSTSAVPEPSAFGLLAGLGALALVASRRRRK